MIGKQKKPVKALIIVLLILGAIWAGFPVLWMLSNSFKTNAEIFEFPPKLITQNFSFEAYAKIFQNPEQVRFFLNSYAISAIVVVLTLFIGIMASYAFSRFEFRGKGLINTVFTLPYCILMVTGYLNTMPRALDEAVMIDGGSRWTALWKILIPSAIPGLISVGMYTFMQAWNEYLFALTLTKTNDMRTVPVGINLLMGQHAYEWNQMMAMSVLGSLPILVLFLFFQKYFIAGMTAGAVK